MRDETPIGARPMRPNRREAIRIVAGAALWPAASLAQNASTPSATAREPIRIIVPYPPGGPTDAIARLIGNELQGDLTGPVVVENKPGAAGALGSREVARAAPDAERRVEQNRFSLMIAGLHHSPPVGVQTLARPLLA